MRKVPLPLLALATGIACTPAHAETRWNYRYDGPLLHKESGKLADESFIGYFIGTDLSGDNVLTQDELSAFTWGSFGFAPAGELASCAIATMCMLKDFAYNIGTGTLDFTSTAKYYMSDGSTTYTMIAGESYTVAGYSSMGGGTATYLWTPDTRLTVAIAPVPEPANMAMLACGIAMLGIIGTRRRRWDARRLPVSGPRSPST